MKTCCLKIYFGIHLKSQGFAFLQENASKKYNQCEKKPLVSAYGGSPEEGIEIPRCR